MSWSVLFFLLMIAGLFTTAAVGHTRELAQGWCEPRRFDASTWTYYVIADVIFACWALALAVFG